MGRTPSSRSKRQHRSRPLHPNHGRSSPSKPVPSRRTPGAVVRSFTSAPPTPFQDRGRTSLLVSVPGRAQLHQQRERAKQTPRPFIHFGPASDPVIRQTSFSSSSGTTSEPSSSPSSPPAIIKQEPGVPDTSKRQELWLYSRRHSFFAGLPGNFSRSQRVGFERDLEDYAHHLGLPKSDAEAEKRAVRGVWSFAGIDEDDEGSAWEGEQSEDTCKEKKRLLVRSTSAAPAWRAMPSDLSGSNESEELRPLKNSTQRKKSTRARSEYFKQARGVGEYESRGDESERTTESTAPPSTVSNGAAPQSEDESSEVERARELLAQVGKTLWSPVDLTQTPLPTPARENRRVDAAPPNTEFQSRKRQHSQTLEPDAGQQIVEADTDVASDKTEIPTRAHHKKKKKHRPEGDDEDTPRRSAKKKTQDVPNRAADADQEVEDDAQDSRTGLLATNAAEPALEPHEQEPTPAPPHIDVESPQINADAAEQTPKSHSKRRKSEHAEKDSAKKRKKKAKKSKDEDKSPSKKKKKGSETPKKSKSSKPKRTEGETTQAEQPVSQTPAQVEPHSTEDAAGVQILAPVTPNRPISKPSPPTTLSLSSISTSTTAQDPFCSDVITPNEARERPKATPRSSRYFNVEKKIKQSSLAFAPLDAKQFGLIQEKLCKSAFHLLAATVFLNKTKGEAAIPRIMAFCTVYETPDVLAKAEPAHLEPFIRPLGMQHQRSAHLVALAREWMKNPPQSGRVRRRPHYPKHGIDPDDHGIAQDDPRVAFEVAHLPAVGPYALDSWRIFCRDALRGGAGTAEMTPAQTEEDVEKEMRQEWTRVLPADKELRRYLQWRWIRLGWLWDPLTGEKAKAGAEVVKAMAARAIREHEGYLNPWMYPIGAGAARDGGCAADHDEPLRGNAPEDEAAEQRDAATPKPRPAPAEHAPRHSAMPAHSRHAASANKTAAAQRSAESAASGSPGCKSLPPGERCGLDTPSKRAVAGPAGREADDGIAESLRILARDKQKARAMIAGRSGRM